MLQPILGHATQARQEVVSRTKHEPPQIEPTQEDIEHVEREHPQATPTQRKLLAKMHARFRVHDEDKVDLESGHCTTWFSVMRGSGGRMVYESRSGMLPTSAQAATRSCDRCCWSLLRF